MKKKFASVGCDREGRGLSTGKKRKRPNTQVELSLPFPFESVSSFIWIRECSAIA